MASHGGARLDLLGPQSKAFLLLVHMTTNKMNKHHDDSYFLNGAMPEGVPFRTQEGTQDAIGAPN